MPGGSSDFTLQEEDPIEIDPSSHVDIQLPRLVVEVVEVSIVRPSLAVGCMVEAALVLVTFPQFNSTSYAARGAHGRPKRT